MSIIGIDVSKVKLDCLWIRDLSTMKLKSKIQANTPTGHKALLEWAMKQTGEQVNELHLVMEATGIYHEALAYALHDAGAQVSVAIFSAARYSTTGKTPPAMNWNTTPMAICSTRATPPNTTPSTRAPCGPGVTMCHPGPSPG